MRKSKRPATRKAGKPRRKPIMRHSREGVKRRSRRPAGKKTARLSAPDLKRQFLDRFASEFPTTLKLMKAYPAGQDEFKPHERSRSAVWLVHTFSVENSVAGGAVRGDLKMPPSIPPPPATLAEAVDSYECGAEELLEAIRAMPESRLLETVPFFAGPGRMGDVPVIDVLWFLLMDSIHHRGQLSVYVRMAGGKVPSIYGPSADEPWA